MCGSLCCSDPAWGQSAPRGLPSGACCFADGNCLEVESALDCTSGDFRVGQGCFPGLCSPCGPECAFCWIGTEFEHACPDNWNGDGQCDCGCQFLDSADCGGGEGGACCMPGGECFDVALPSACEGSFLADLVCAANPCPGDPCVSYCDMCWQGTDFENDCPDGFNGDGEICDCACQFVDEDCPVNACCQPDGTCEQVFEQSECAGEFLADTLCTFELCGGGENCGNDVCEPGEDCENCPFDCNCDEPGSCCMANGSCTNNIESLVCLSVAGAFGGPGSTCDDPGACPECDDVCERCWVGTILENDCFDDLNGDGLCDCGCQFVDADCNAECGNSTCEPSESCVNCAADCGGCAGSQGACCFGDGSCTTEPSEACVSNFTCDVTTNETPDCGGPCGTTCFGDVNGDGVVTPADRGFISANVGATEPAILCQYDLDGNGVVTVSDRGFVAANIGECVALPDYQNGSGMNGGMADTRFPRPIWLGAGTDCDTATCP